MTDREKAIVMAYTGKCMLTGDKLQIFHKYVEDIMGRPVWTHEMGIGSIADEIKEKSKGDFIALCADESHSGKQNKWIAAEVLDKIKAEIEQMPSELTADGRRMIRRVSVFRIIDKYKASPTGAEGSEE